MAVTSAAALIPPLAQELPFATGAAVKRKIKKFWKSFAEVKQRKDLLTFVIIFSFLCLFAFAAFPALCVMLRCFTNEFKFPSIDTKTLANNNNHSRLGDDFLRARNCRKCPPCLISSHRNNYVISILQIRIEKFVWSGHLAHGRITGKSQHRTWNLAGRWPDRGRFSVLTSTEIWW